MSEEPTYGQKGAMEDASMVGTLSTQIEMIWPHERPVLERWGFAEAGRLVDLACGTGRFLLRAAAAWPHMHLVGVDRHDVHLQVGRREVDDLDPPADVELRLGDARATELAASSFDVAVMRHVLQAVGDRDAFYAEAHRLLRKGGQCYVLAEDYQGFLIDAPAPARDLFLDAAPGIVSSGTHLFHGREVYRDLHRHGFEDVRVASIVVDVANTDRTLMADMMRHWRDGYAGFMAPFLGTDTAESARRYDDIAAAIEDPERYVGWWLLCVAGRRVR